MIKLEGLKENSNEEIRLDGIYGFATNRAVYLVDTETETDFIVRFNEQAMEICDGRDSQTIEEFLTSFDIILEEHVIKVFYKREDFIISIFI